MKRFFAIVLLLLLGAQMSAKHSDEFLIGTYSYIRNSFPFFMEQRETLSRFMQEMGYNSNIIETDLQDPDLAGLLETLDRHGIDAWITDRGFSMDPTNGARYAITPLTTSSYQRWEAEYVDESEVNPGDGKDSKFWYASRNEAALPRTGQALKQKSASNGFVWQARRGHNQAGYAMGDLRYRWPNINGAYVRTGFDFHFYQQNPPSHEGQNLWITYRFRISDVAPSTKPEDALLTFQAAGYALSPSGFSTKAAELKSRSVKGVAAEQQFSYQDLQQAKERDGYLEYTLQVPYTELLAANLLQTPSSIMFILTNLNPRLYWHGNCTLELDYVDMQDQISYELHRMEPEFKEGIQNRARKLISQGKGNVSGIYSFDEPFQGQFDSFGILQGVLAEAGIPMITATYDHQGSNIVIDKGRNLFYDHLDVFLREVQPIIYTPDIYPLQPKYAFNPGVKGQPFIQDVLDSKLLSVYDKGIRYTQADPQRKFYPIVQAFGRWAKGSPDRWGEWILPPYATQKALLYLPLVYGADGVFHYRLQAFQTDGGYGDYVGLTSQLSGGKWKAPELSRITMDAILHSNPKVKTYGLIIQDLKWTGANSVMPKAAKRHQIPGSAMIREMYVENQPEAPYSGYIQTGHYLDREKKPWLMAVNRRGNYFHAPAAELEANVHPSLYDEYFPQADAQILHVQFDKKAKKQFGTYIGLWDPETGTVISSDNRQRVAIELPAGESGLYQVLQTLPPVLNRSLTVKGEATIVGDVVLEKGAKLKLHENSKLILSPGARLMVSPGAAIAMAGRIELQGDSQMHILGTINKDKAKIEKSEEAVLLKNPQPRRSFFKRLFGIK
jgi:hypothetical protein